MSTLVIVDPVLNYAAYASPADPIPNTYVSEEDFIAAYTSLNDPIAAEADSETICAALIYGYQYMQQNFRMRYVGARVKAYQYADWPRRGVPIPDFFDPYFRNTNVPFEFRHTVFFGEDVVPQEVKDAQILLARHSLTSTTTQQSLETSLGRRTKREKLGDLEVEYFDTGEGNQNVETTFYWDAHKRLEPYLKPTTVGTVLRS